MELNSGTKSKNQMSEETLRTSALDHRTHSEPCRDLDREEDTRTVSAPELSWLEKVFLFLFFFQTHLWNPHLRVHRPGKVCAEARCHSWRWPRQRTAECPPRRGPEARRVWLLRSAVTKREEGEHLCVIAPALCSLIGGAVLPARPCEAAAGPASSWRTPWPWPRCFSSHSRSLCTAASEPREPPGTRGSSGSESTAISGPLVSDNSTRSTRCSRCSCSVSEWSPLRRPGSSPPPPAWRCCGPAGRCRRCGSPARTGVHGRDRWHHPALCVRDGLDGTHCSSSWTFLYTESFRVTHVDSSVFVKHPSILVS